MAATDESESESLLSLRSRQCLDDIKAKVSSIDCSLQGENDANENEDTQQPRTMSRVSSSPCPCPCPGPPYPNPDPDPGPAPTPLGRSGWAFHSLPSKEKTSSPPISIVVPSECDDAPPAAPPTPTPTPTRCNDQTPPDLRDKFHADGFLCLGSILPASLVTELRRAAEENFAECFRVLYERGHSSFPWSYRRRARKDGPRCVRSGSSLSSIADGGGKCGGDECECECECEYEYECEYPLSQGVAGGFREIVMRSPGRYEMPYRCDAHPFGDHVLDAAKEAGLIDLVRNLLSERDNGCGEADARTIEVGDDGDGDDNDDDESYYLSNLSLVVSTPGSSDQGWHADGGHVDLGTHRPCHCLNVFIPLVDVLSDEIGPTELRPGTHVHTRNLAPMMLAARARRTLRCPAMPLLRAGDALVFDYRILHRGRANRTVDFDRPVLVLTFAKRWFRDVLNFPKRTMMDGLGYGPDY